MCMWKGERGRGCFDLPRGITALERSHTPSSSLRIVSGLRCRLSSAETSSTEGAGAAKMVGAKARANAKVLEKSIVGDVVGGGR